MVRFLGFCVGLLFVVVLLVAALLPRDASTPDAVAALHKAPRQASWQQDKPFGTGVFGTYDRGQLQRGFQVFSEVCSACHGLDHVAFRNLEAIGFSEAEVKALAKAKEVAAVDENTGEPTTRPALPADFWPSPYPNEVAARAANNNALPPDLSLIIKARHDGKRYLYSLLTGYGETPPEGFEVPAGLHYNPWFSSVNIAMPQILFDEQLEYADGTKATTDQMAKDVVAFLDWAAQPELEQRHRIGVGVMIFLVILTILAWLSKRRVWADIPH